MKNNNNKESRVDGAVVLPTMVVSGGRKMATISQMVFKDIEKCVDAIREKEKKITADELCRQSEPMMMEQFFYQGYMFASGAGVTERDIDAMISKYRKECRE